MPNEKFYFRLSKISTMSLIEANKCTVPDLASNQALRYIEAFRARNIVEEKWNTQTFASSLRKRQKFRFFLNFNLSRTGQLERCAVLPIPYHTNLLLFVNDLHICDTER